MSDQRNMRADFARLVMIARRRFVPVRGKTLPEIMMRTSRLAVWVEADAVWKGGRGALPPTLCLPQGVVAIAAMEVAWLAGEPWCGLTAARISNLAVSTDE